MAVAINNIPNAAYSHRLFVRPKNLTTGAALRVVKNQSQLNSDADSEIIPTSKNNDCIMWCRNMLFFFF